MEFYSAINNKIMPFTGKWMELKFITLNENKTVPQRQVLHVFSHIWNLLGGGHGKLKGYY
jgi:hypothetical protein